MQTLTIEQACDKSMEVLLGAGQGTPSLVMKNGERLCMVLPLGAHLRPQNVRLEVACDMFDAELVGLSGAAQIAGLPLGAMMDELSKREIPVVRYSEEEWEQELAHVNLLALRR